MTHIAQKAIGTMWHKEHLNLNETQTVNLLTNSKIEAQKTFFLPTEPQITLSKDHQARCSFSLILSEQPGVEETNIFAYIKRSQLTMELAMSYPIDIVEKIKSLKSPQNYNPLFIQSMDYQLVAQQDCEKNSYEILVSGKGSMGQGKSKLAVFLNKTETLAVLAILENRPSNLFLAMNMSYRGASQRKSIVLKGNWAAIYDFIQSKLVYESYISASQLLSCLEEMQATELLRAYTSTGEKMVLEVEDLAQIFFRQVAIILQKENQTDEAEDALYYLRNRPHESFNLNYQQTINTNKRHNHQWKVPLEKVIDRALQDENAIKILVEQGGDRPALVPVAKQQGRTKKTARSNRGGENGKIQLATNNGMITSLSLSTQPSLNSHVRPNLNLLALQHQPFYATFLDDLVIATNKTAKLKHFPVVRKMNEPYWRDRITSNKFWYAPIFEVEPPQASKSVDENTFSFTFERTGMTNDGKVGLKGKINFRLTRKMSNATEIALEKDNITNVRAVQPLFLRVKLLIPFIDSTDGTLKYHGLTANVKDEGTHLTAEVEVLNEWVNLAYGALSLPNFQLEPVEVQVIYSFKSYTIIKSSRFEFTYGGKALYTPLSYSPTQQPLLGHATYLDVNKLTYVSPTFNLNLNTVTNIRPRGGGKRNPFLNIGISAQTTINSSVFPRPVVTPSPIFTYPIGIKPTLTLAPTLRPFLTTTKYATQTQVRQQTIDMVVPCAAFGHLYQEKANHGTTALGCQDAFGLGTTEYKQYEEMLSLRDDDYFKVYKSLQQPGRFLVVPNRFCITRRAADQEDAYHPLIFLNSVIDAENPQNNRAELRITLQPDIPVYRRLQLEEHLKTLSPEPVVEYPTDVISEDITFYWALDSSIDTQSDIELSYAAGPFLSTSFYMSLANWQLVKDLLSEPGISGTISFKLTDNTILSSGLFLKLDEIRGPWETGPISISIENGNTKIENHVENDLAISHLENFQTGSRLAAVPVETTIESGRSHTLTGQHDLTPVYEYLPADAITIDEIRSFVEDIYTTVIFLNQINMTNLGLERLKIEAKIRGMTDAIAVQLTADMSVEEVPIILPLTSYLQDRILDFKITKYYTEPGEASKTSPWMEYNLNNATLVSITPDLVAHATE